jgi:hypothetical protein
MTAQILKFPRKEYKCFNQSYRISGPDKDIHGGPMPRSLACLDSELAPIIARGNANIEKRITAFLDKQNARECGERTNYLWIDSKPGKTGAYLCLRTYILHTG